MRLIDWYPSTLLPTAIFLITLSAFATSALAFSPAYRSVLKRLSEDIASLTVFVRKMRNRWNVTVGTLWTLHVIGFFGLGIYLAQILIELGGLVALIDALFEESYLIRNAEIDQVGIYFSYFGWIAISLTVLRWKLHRRLTVELQLALLLQIGGNLLFIDRTRPIWLGLTSVLIVLPFARFVSMWRIAWGALIVAILGVTVFVAIAFWVGKTGEGLESYGDVELGLGSLAFYYYMTNGFPYFEELLKITLDHDYIPQRTLYPLYKLAAILGLASDPPSQILDFLYAPFPTNVGTFLEPYFSDGGFLYLAFGIVLATVGVDLLALLFLRAANPFALYGWANLCFVSFISFFVPKLVSTPVWLFVLLALASMTLRAALRPIRTPNSSAPIAQRS